MIEATTANTLSHERLKPWRALLPVAVAPLTILFLGIASTSLYFWGRDLHRFTQWLAAYIALFVGQLALYVMACYVVERRPRSATRAATLVTLALVIFFAAASRGVLAPQRPYLSSDVYRYVWDGYVQANGINPYRYVPEADELSGLRDDRIYPNINREDKQWRSPYPPVAQLVFLGIARIAPLSVTAVKFAMSSFDLLTIVLLMLALARSGMDPARAIIFAWHPLVIFEGAHSGHLDAVYVAFLAMTLLAWTMRADAITGAGLGLASLVKFYPVLLLPVFLLANPGSTPDLSPGQNYESIRSKFWRLAGRVVHRRNLVIIIAFGATVTLAYGAYGWEGISAFWSLRGYAEEEGFIRSGERYALLGLVRRLVSIPTNVFLVIAAVCLMALAVWQFMRVKRNAADVARGALTLIGTYLLVTTPRYAWYYVWLVPFLCFAPRLGWFYLSCGSVLLYLVWYTPLVYPGVPGWLAAGIYLPTLAWLVWEGARLRRSEVAGAIGNSK
jgi:hypothetical protein